MLLLLPSHLGPCEQHSLPLPGEPLFPGHIHRPHCPSFSSTRPLPPRQPLKQIHACTPGQPIRQPPAVFASRQNLETPSHFQAPLILPTAWKVGLSATHFRDGEAEAQRGRNLPRSHSWRDRGGPGMVPLSCVHRQGIGDPSAPSLLQSFVSGIRDSRTCSEKVRNAPRPSPEFLAPASR